MASGHEIQVDTTLDRRETSAQTSDKCPDSLNRLAVTIHRALVQKSFHEAIRANVRIPKRQPLARIFVG